MSKPIILAVDSAAAARQITERLLRNRYGIDYAVICEDSPPRPRNSCSKRSDRTVRSR
jgi:hypothetical protein